jgi:hypothetical protein
VAEHNGIVTRPPSSKDALALLKWALVVPLALCGPVSLFLCWHLQRQLDQAKDEQAQARRELASLHRVRVVEQSGVFKLDAVRGRGKPVYYPRPYDAPPGIKLEPIFRPVVDLGDGLSEAELRELQKRRDAQAREDFQKAMKAFDLMAVYPDHFRWEMHIDRAGGSYPAIEVRWTARGLVVSKGETAK